MDAFDNLEPAGPNKYELHGPNIDGLDDYEYEAQKDRLAPLAKQVGLSIPGVTQVEAYYEGKGMWVLHVTRKAGHSARGRRARGPGPRDRDLGIWSHGGYTYLKESKALYDDTTRQARAGIVTCGIPVGTGIFSFQGHYLGAFYDCDAEQSHYSGFSLIVVRKHKGDYYAATKIRPIDVYFDRKPDFEDENLRVDPVEFPFWPNKYPEKVYQLYYPYWTGRRAMSKAEKRALVAQAWEKQGAVSRPAEDLPPPIPGMEGPFRYRSGKVLVL